MAAACSRRLGVLMLEQLGCNRRCVVDGNLRRRCSRSNELGEVTEASAAFMVSNPWNGVAVVGGCGCESVERSHAPAQLVIFEQRVLELGFDVSLLRLRVSDHDRDLAQLEVDLNITTIDCR